MVRAATEQQRHPTRQKFDLGHVDGDRLRSGVFARWIGIVALVGALAFLITFFALIQGTSEDSVFGYGFLPGILALAIWSSATSVATYRAVEITAR